MTSKEVWYEVVGPAVPTVTGIPYLQKPSLLLVGALSIGRLTSLRLKMEC